MVRSSSAGQRTDKDVLLEVAAGTAVRTLPLLCMRHWPCTLSPCPLVTTWVYRRVFQLPATGHASMTPLQRPSPWQDGTAHCLWQCYAVLAQSRHPRARQAGTCITSNLFYGWTGGSERQRAALQPGQHQLAQPSSVDAAVQHRTHPLAGDGSFGVHGSPC